MARFALLGAALVAALAAWLCQGSMGLAEPGGSRLAVLPLSAASLGTGALGAALVVMLHRAGASLQPLWLLALLLLPWMPVPVPPAFLLWTGPAAVLVCALVLVLMVASMAPPRLGAIGAIKRPQAVAGVLACVLFAAAAWRVAPMVPGGDEPHYLVITQSLLLDRDLAIEEVHRRGDYRTYFSGDLRPDFQRRGADGRIYSIHAPGLAVLIAPAFALGGHPGVVVFLILLASLGAALAWHLAWIATRRADAAWFGWASVTLPVTAVFQSFTIYPDGPGGLLALTGLWALLRADQESRSTIVRTWPWVLHGAALAALPWLHSRFATLAGGFGALILLRLATTRNPAGKAVAFLSVPALSATLWVGFFVAIYGTPDPSAPYAPGGGSFRFVPGGLGGLLFDGRFGLLAYAPVVACAFAGLGSMIVRRSSRRLALELLFVVVPYLLTVTHFAMWWGGWSAPARFFAPVLPLFAVPAAVAWTSTARRADRFAASAVLVCTVVASGVTVWVERGRLAFNTRDAPALWLEWFGRLADVASAAPTWARDTDVPLFRAVAVWTGVLIAALLIIRRLDRAGGLEPRARFHTAAAGVVAAAVMLGASAVWALERKDGRSTLSSQLQLLEAAASRPDDIGLQVEGWTRVAAADVPGRLRIQLDRLPARRSGGRDGSPLFTLPPIPAGDYRLTVVPDGPPGWLMVGVARDPRDPFAVRTVQLPAGALDLRFAVSLRGLSVRGDEDAWERVRRLVLQPVRVRPPDARLTTALARRAVRYGDWIVYFFDDRSFPEPDAFWVGGGRDSTIALQPDRGGAAARLRLRNAPVNNRVSLEAGRWRRDFRMGPGEEMTIEVPLDPRRGGIALRLASAEGFRPSDGDPASRDGRYLGVWVTLE